MRGNVTVVTVVVVVVVVVVVMYTLPLHFAIFKCNSQPGVAIRFFEKWLGLSK